MSFYYYKQWIKWLKFHLLAVYRKNSIGKNCNIGLNSILEGRNVINSGTILNGKLGYGTYVGNNCSLHGLIGKYCSIGSHVQTVIGQHPTSLFVSTHPAFYSLLKQSGFTYVEKQLYEESIYADIINGYFIIIGNDVWICDGVKILAGLKIGDGAVLATGSIVTTDVEPYAIYAGIPAKKIGQRFDDDTIDKLLEIRWWSKGEEWIKQNAYLFENAEEFISKCK